MLTGTRQQSLEIMYELTKYWWGELEFFRGLGGGGCMELTKHTSF